LIQPLLQTKEGSVDQGPRQCGTSTIPHCNAMIPELETSLCIIRKSSHSEIQLTLNLLKLYLHAPWIEQRMQGHGKYIK